MRRGTGSDAYVSRRRNVRARRDRAGLPALPDGSAVGGTVRRAFVGAFRVAKRVALGGALERSVAAADGLAHQQPERAAAVLAREPRNVIS